MVWRTCKKLRESLLLSLEQIQQQQTVSLFLQSLT